MEAAPYDHVFGTCKTKGCGAPAVDGLCSKCKKILGVKPYKGKRYI